MAEADAIYGPLAALALAPDTAPRLAAVRPALQQVRACMMYNYMWCLHDFAGVCINTSC